jgi:hypothetical protein
MAFVIGAIIGVVCALLRYRVLMVLPLGVLLAVATVLSGIVLHVHPGLIAAEVFGSIAAPQIAYVAVSLTRHLVRSRKLIQQIQAAIGQELGTELEVPRNLSPELAVLVARLTPA